MMLRVRKVVMRRPMAGMRYLNPVGSGFDMVMAKVR
jgi:hypothetical protein